MGSQVTVQSGSKSPSIAPKDAKNIKLLTEELQKLKNINEQLISKIESKNDQVIFFHIVFVTWHQGTWGYTNFIEIIL